MRMFPYPVNVEEQMKRFYATLSEKDQRRYAAVEAMKSGHGGKKYVCDLLGCDLKTLNKGMKDLGDDEALALSRIRRPGGGRKPILEQHPELDDIFLQVIHDHTAGLPTDAEVKWTNLSRPGLADLLAAEGVSVSPPVIDQLLEKHDFCKRKAFKTIPGGLHPDRDA